MTGPAAKIAGIVAKSEAWRKSEYRFGFFGSNLTFHN